MEKEINRKDKALAETAALLVLKKKVREIWGGRGQPHSQEQRNLKNTVLVLEQGHTMLFWTNILGQFRERNT